jgi:uncharacterized protein (DUF1015 family)
MAEIVPFRGVLYDPARAGPVDRLIAPPYDVISPAERTALAAKSPHNFVRLILPEGEGDEKYSRAANLLAEWQREGVLRRDEKPALYRYHQTFSALGWELTRKGFIGRIRLRRYDEKVVLPHERTLTGPKLDRLKLKRATRTHLSQVLAVYPDRTGAVDAAFAETDAARPDLEARMDGVVHRIFRLTDGNLQARIAAAMADKRVYIADGHHRYETMLALRDELRPLASSPDSSVEFGSIFLTRMEDPGLLILPTHRVVHGLGNFDHGRFVERVREQFEVEEMPAISPSELREKLATKGRARPAFLVALGQRRLLLVLRPGAEVAVKGPAALRTVDVAVLHALIFEQILGIDRAAQEKQANLRYVKDFEAALGEAALVGVQAAFLLNPTKVEQLQAVADSGEVMPQKSTYFFPKLASGLVLNPIVPGEKVDLLGPGPGSR